MFNFKSIIIESFIFLEEQYNFSKDENCYGFIYKSSEFSISFSYDIVRSSEFFIDIQSVDKKHSYCFSDVMKIFNKSPLPLIHTIDQEILKKLLKKSSIQIKEIIEKAINNQQLFNLLEDQQRHRSEAYALTKRLEIMREELSLHWSHRNYHAVISILEDNIDNLTKSEIHKLDYAKKHV